jgi:hypothetical protein
MHGMEIPSEERLVLMAVYFFNVMETYAVIAENQEQAQEYLDSGVGELQDRDTLLVEVNEHYGNL